MNKETNVPRGFGFVTFVHEGGAENAMRLFPGEINGKQASVKWAEPKNEEEPQEPPEPRAAGAPAREFYPEPGAPAREFYGEFSYQPPNEYSVEMEDAAMWREKYFQERDLRMDLERRLADIETRQYQTLRPTSRDPAPSSWGTAAEPRAAPYPRGAPPVRVERHARPAASRYGPY
mmetsp:Transcript_10013/g.17721  ORF Transcript_10013/g.17721 Transcript_10013/m.17721 type:complete len:176 (-) Transcript_10013:313-840(-)